MEDNNYFKGLTRKEYIEHAGKLLEKSGKSDLTIRELSKDIGCSSSALYRYFKNKDELMYFVNLGILDKYVTRLNKAAEHWTCPWDNYVGVWDCYCREAFMNIHAYDQLFFKNTNVELNKSIHEFYEMFPDNISRSNKIFQSMLSRPDFLGRDYLVALDCAEQGAISIEKAKILNRSVCMLYKGYFKTIKDEGIEQYGADPWTRQCVADIDMIVFALADDLKGYKGYYEGNPASSID